MDVKFQFRLSMAVVGPRSAYIKMRLARRRGCFRFMSIMDIACSSGVDIFLDLMTPQMVGGM
jgi:hypothetical protein